MIVIEKVKREDVKCGICGEPLTFTLFWENGKYAWSYECEKCSAKKKFRRDQGEEVREELVDRLVRSW
ncbi:MAG: hypothetical protein ACTSWP_06165 [Candidatus Freyarchaeota archaeon]|nr:hypothetical protein [Candidatus Freyrarchaeum guaymaensis]